MAIATPKFWGEKVRGHDNPRLMGVAKTPSIRTPGGKENGTAINSYDVFIYNLGGIVDVMGT